MNLTSYATDIKSRLYARINPWTLPLESSALTITAVGLALSSFLRPNASISCYIRNLKYLYTQALRSTQVALSRCFFINGQRFALPLINGPYGHSWRRGRWDRIRNIL